MLQKRHIIITCLLFTLVACIMTSCKDDLDKFDTTIPTPSLTLRDLSLTVEGYSNNTYQFGAVGVGQTLGYTVESTNSPWQLTSAADWLTFSNVSGDGENTYATGTITVAPNYETSSRTTTFDLSSTDDKWPYTSQYSLYQDRAGDFIKINPLPGQGEYDTPILTLDAHGSAVSISSLTNLPTVYWTFPSWISTEYTFQDHVLTLTVTATENDESADRSGYIYFYSDKDHNYMMASVQVRQLCGNITASTEYIGFENKRSDVAINITTDLSWNVTTNSDGNWLSVTPQTGKGNGTITISATANDYNYDREGSVYIMTGENQRILIPVRQQRSYVSVDSASFKVSASQQDIILSVKSNTTWTITGQDSYSWLSLSETSGEGSKEVKIRVSSNNSTDSRKAVIKVGHTGFDSPAQVYIYQSGKTVGFSENTITIDAATLYRDVQVKSDGNWTATVDETDREWLKLRISTDSGSGSSSVSDSGDKTLRIIATENNTETNRVGHVRVSIGDASPSVLTVIQKGRYFTINNPEAEFRATGGKHKIFFSTNTNWTASLVRKSDWIHLDKTTNTSTGSDSITVSVDANPSINSRRDTLIITPSIGQAIRVVLTQAARNLTVNTTAIKFFATGGTSSAITIKHDGNYKVAKRAEDNWLTVNETKDAFTVTATANNNEQRREGLITVSLENLPSGEEYKIGIPVSQYGTGDTTIREDFDSDENWNIGGTSSVSISVVGFKTDENWNIGGSSTLIITVTGFKSDEDWTIGGN